MAHALKSAAMSIADALRVIALENRIVDLAKLNRVLVARISALEDHLINFQAAVEARQTLELSASTAYPVSAGQEPPTAAARNAEACPTCVRRREQAQARLRRHRTKVSAADGKTLPAASA